MDHDSGGPEPSIAPQTGNNEESPPLSTRGLVIVFAALAVGLVLGYLFLSKLIDISQEEDCALAHRYNCGAVDIKR